MTQDTRRPNLFIVGAPKCGTTSLATWLSECPQVFMSALKEPNHFNTDLNSCEMADRQEYENLFALAKPEHLLIGEASTKYLYSSAALSNILDYNPEARIIALVRNPVDMAVSWHGHRLFSGKEDIENFEQAWRLQSVRSSGLFIPPLCPDPELLQYGAVCSLGTQVKRMFELVPREQRHVLVLDDVRQNPLKEWKAVRRFLGVDGDGDGRTQFPIHNAAKRVRSKKLRMATRTFAHAKDALRIPRFRLGVLKHIDRANRREQPNNPISRRVRLELAEYFSEDVSLLGDLLERNFSSWLTV